MQITVYRGLDDDGKPIVSVQGDLSDTPEQVAEAYLKTVEKLKESKTK